VKFPIKYFDGNIIVNDNLDVWAVYKIKNFNYDFCTTDKKFEILERLNRFLVNIGDEAKIFIIPSKIDYNKHFEKLIKNLDKDDIYSNSKDYLEDIHFYIDNSDVKEINDYEVYVLTNLTEKKETAENIRDFLNAFAIEPVKTINDFFGVSAKEMSKSKLESYKKFAYEYERVQQKRLVFEPVSEFVTKWLIKRVFYRGLKDDCINIWKDWKPDLKATKEELTMMLSDGILNQNFKRSLKIEHIDNTESYQTFLPITKIPEVDFPGSEYLIYQNLMGIGVETCITINNVENRKALRILERKRKEIKAQMEHIDHNAEDVPDDILDARNYVDDLENDLKSTDSPLSHISITFCVSDTDFNRLNEKANQVISNYRDMHFGIERPMTDQERLFLEFMPGTGRYLKDYIMPITPRILAGGIFGATCDLGDNVGFYIGKGGSLHKPIFLDLLHACQLNKPAAAFILGAQGYGKTFTSNLLVYLHVLNGAKAFIIDPKGDRNDWEIKLPELARYINTIHFSSSKEDMGKLDPFIIYKDDMGEAGQLAINILSELLNIDPSSKTSLALKEAVEVTKSIKFACMAVLAGILDNFDKDDNCYEEAKLLARQIRNLNRADLTGLLYGNGTEESLSFDKKINILMIQDLKLPISSNTSKKDYTYEEKLGTVIMLAVANFAKKFSQMDNSTRKVVVMDEAWALAKTQQGEDLFERLARTGRSLNTSCIFIGHSSRDVTTEGIRNSIRYKFVFNVGNREEAIHTLEFLGMEITEENITILTSDDRGLSNGECLFYDAYGRLGILQIDPVKSHLISAFRTTPPQKKAVK
jgi:hypothetical protein